MDLNYKDIQLQYQGFLNTPLLWKSDVVFGLKQFEIPNITSTTFEGSIAKKLRLGMRVERFVSSLLKQFPSNKIIAENIQIQDGTTTLGEIDCLLTTNQQPIHLEIVYKFYLYDATIGSSELEHWIGPNRNDNLVKKLTKLKEKQLPLLFKPQAKPLLEKFNFNLENCTQQVYFKAQLFVPYQFENTIFNFINKDCIVGFYINYNQLAEFKNCKFYIPSKVNWLQEIQIQTTWLTYQHFSTKLHPIIENKTSPLCWIKHPNGEVEKFFVVWWQ